MKGVIFMNGIVVGFFLSILVAAPNIFLSKAPDSNAFVHGVAFMMAFGPVIARKHAYHVHAEHNEPFVCF